MESRPPAPSSPLLDHPGHQAFVEPRGKHSTPESASAVPLRSSLVPAGRVTLAAVLRPKRRFTYTHDFGDGWEHDIVVEKLAPGEETVPRSSPAHGRAPRRTAAEAGATRSSSKPSPTRVMTAMRISSTGCRKAGARDPSIRRDQSSAGPPREETSQGAKRSATRTCSRLANSSSLGAPDRRMAG
jgi:hypothetical protein